MSPELQILTINAVCLGAAYLVFYPGLQRKTLRALAIGDLAVTVLALGVAGALFAGSGTPFALGSVTVSWWVFSLLTGAMIEAPLLWWFWRRYRPE